MSGNHENESSEELVPVPVGESEPSADALGIELPDDPEEAARILLDRLVESRSEADALLSDLQRVAADYENFRKRIGRDQAQTVKRASSRVISSLLPVLDSLDAGRALDADSPGAKKILDGLRSTHDQLLDILGREGLSPIETIGVAFDPERHEAVIAPSESSGVLTVEQELRRGYTLNGAVLRVALVAVAYREDQA